MRPDLVVYYEGGNDLQLGTVVKKVPEVILNRGVLILWENSHDHATSEGPSVLTYGFTACARFAWLPYGGGLSITASGCWWRRRT